jgi:hypothetical protein
MMWAVTSPLLYLLQDHARLQARKMTTVALVTPLSLALYSTHLVFGLETCNYYYYYYYYHYHYTVQISVQYRV